MEEDKSVNPENTKAQMRKGILEYVVLLAISKDAIYASDILALLKKENLIVVEGTLYPLLSRLKQAELVAYEWRESAAGPPRKYYKLTDRGRTTLKQLTQTWQGLSKSINALIKKHAQDN